MALGFSIALRTELFVIELKTALLTLMSCMAPFSFSSSYMCQAIASPSLSGSVANIKCSAFLRRLRISLTCSLPLLFKDHLISDQEPGMTAPSLSLIHI